MFLMSCAQIVGKPPMTSDPIAAPAAAAPALRTARLESPFFTIGRFEDALLEDA
jgi:hypothetical protein